MEKNFELETILTITTRINCNDDYNKVYELVQFVYNDPYINTLGLKVLYRELKEHILNLHPYLRNVRFYGNLGIHISTWIEEQKMQFGDFLPICQIGFSLNNSVNIKKIKTI